MANESLNDTINKSLLTLEREAHKKKYHWRMFSTIGVHTHTYTEFSLYDLKVWKET
jgi:hypothetical protein